MELQDLLEERKIWLVYVDNGYFHGAYSTLNKALKAAETYVREDIENEDYGNNIIATLRYESSKNPDEFGYSDYIIVESTVVDGDEIC